MTNHVVNAPVVDWLGDKSPTNPHLLPDLG